MDVTLWLAFIGTVLIFMSTPGPSHILMFATSLTNGPRRALATAAGDLSANAIQITLAGLGLAAVIMTSRSAFLAIKWLGVAYLIWLGVKMWRKAGSADTKSIAPATLRTLYLRGFVTSASNPKAIVFFAALLPQFISPNAPIAPQVAILGLSYILIDGAFLAAYGRGAGWLAQRLSGQKTRWIDRLAGAGFIGTAILLGLKTLPK